MAQTVRTAVDVRMMEFNFTDNDGEVFASFRMNPGDLNAVKRFDDAIRFFEKTRNRKISDANALVSLNRKLEEKICYAIGCSRESVFGKVPAATVLPDGEFFAAKVLWVVKDAICEETARRRKARMDAVNKYAGKYDADPSAGLAPGQEV